MPGDSLGDGIHVDPFAGPLERTVRAAPASNRGDLSGR